MRTCRVTTFVILWLAAASAAAAQAAHLTSREAKNHVGEKATVCGKVVGIHFVSSGKGQPTFIHFDEPYPDQIFTLVIGEATGRSLAARKRSIEIKVYA